MNLFRKCSIIALVFLLCGFGFKRMDYRDGMYNNVCKELRGNVLVYFVFVDSRETAPWTEFDIQSTLDSMEVAIRWIEQQAKVNNVSLRIISDYFIGNEYTTVKRNLPYQSVEISATTPSLPKGLDALSEWADKIAQRIGKEAHIEPKDGIPEIRNPRNKERLVAHLRDQKQVESVALLFMVNNYYRDDISIAVNHLDTEDVEFAIVSYKYPSVIAQNILNLFGAADLSKSVYRRQEQKIRMAYEFFPDDIMQDVYARSIRELETGDFTKYLIGWETELDSKFDPLLTDKIINY